MKLKRILVVSALACAAPLVTLGANDAFADCTMQTQMQSAAQATQQQRLTSINSNMQTLAYLNTLQTQCMQAFQSVPTQMTGNGMVAVTAMNKISQAACTSLANQARNTAQSALASAQAAAQQQINNIESNVVNSAGGTGTMLGNTTSQTLNTSTGGVLGNLTNSLSRLFQ